MHQPAVCDAFVGAPVADLVHAEAHVWYQAVELLKPGGALVLVGIPESDRVSFRVDSMRRKELRLQNVRRQNDCTKAAIDLVASGAVIVDPLATHHFTLDETKAAFDHVADYADGIVKAIIHVANSPAQP